MSEESEFVVLLLAKLRVADQGPDWPDSVEYDESTRAPRLTYPRPDGESRAVRLALAPDGVREWLESVSLEDDVQALWGPGVNRVEGAARLATIHLQERVATNRDDPLVIRYGVAK